MVSPLGEPSFDMVFSFFILLPDMSSFFMPLFMPVVVPLSIDPFSMDPLLMPGLVMLSCCAEGPVDWASAEPHIRERAAVAIRNFFIISSLGFLCAVTTFSEEGCS